MNFLLPHQLTSRQFMMWYFSRQTRDKLSSIFPPVGRGPKSCFPRIHSFGQGQYGLILNSPLRDLNCSSGNFAYRGSEGLRDPTISKTKNKIKTAFRLCFNQITIKKHQKHSWRGFEVGGIWISSYEQQTTLRPGSDADLFMSRTQYIELSTWKVPRWINRPCHGFRRHLGE